MARVPRNFIDIDFENDPHPTGLIEQSHAEIMRALKPANVAVGDFASDYPALMLTKSKRHELAKATWSKLKKQRGPTKNQKNTSACVGFASAKALENAIRRNYGKRFAIELSGMDVYKTIGRTIMSGAMVSDGMERAAEGVLALDTAENFARFDLCWGNERADYSRRRPSGWENNVVARVTKYAVAQGADAIESGLSQGIPGTYGRSSHCINPHALAIDNGDPFVAYDNSWGDWGDGGIGYDSYRTYRNLWMYFVMEISLTPIVVIPRL